MRLYSISMIGVHAPRRSGVETGTPGGTVAAADDPTARRLRDLQAAWQRLQAMPGASASPKQAAMNRLGLLRQRLVALKAALLHATPEQARVLARELRSIAQELAAIARSLGAGGGGSSGTAEAEATAGGLPAADAAPDDGRARGVAAASSPSPAGTTGGQQPADATDSARADGDGGDAGGAAGTGRAAPGDDDRPLRAALRDAEKLLKEAIALLKVKLAAADKAARRDLHAAEDGVAERDRAPAQGTAADCYAPPGGLGGFSAAGGIRASSALIGLSVDLSA